MVSVEITAVNLFSGFPLRKLKVGSIVEVDEVTAERWKLENKAKDSDKRKGDKIETDKKGK